MQTVDARAAVSPPFSTLVALLRWRAAHDPERLAYTFMVDDHAAVSLSYAELDQRARVIAASLQSFAAPGSRALLLYPPGLEYLAGFFGCLYAGLVAVPAYPPQHPRLLPRLQAIVADAAPACVLSSTSVHARLDRASTALAQLAELPWLVTDQLKDDAAVDWSAPTLDSAMLALLQYTSGSTAQPKGVMLSHGNLLHNLQLIQQGFGHSAESRGVIWLPPYHDMGLIGGILQPLYAGFPVTLLAPVAFLQRPLRWLQAISRSRATTSGGPNFAYDLCVRSISAEQRAQLDLSSWQVAFTGAEPVRAATLDRFAAMFAPCGFRAEAFYPCYGLAEATLIVAGGERAALPVVRTLDSAALAHDQAQPLPAADPAGRALVGCGTALSDLQVVIADPQTFHERQPGQIGEIWVAGPSVARGYWNRPEQTAETFQAELAGRAAGPFLRTGDLGFVLDDQLFITGRLKDLIIIRGRNHYPQDIELTVESSHGALRPGGGAAFGVEIDGVERLVVVQEVERQARHTPLAELIGAIRQALAEQHELQAAAIMLIKPASIPKTSSGKIQRHACRAAFLSGQLDLLGEWRADTSAAADVPVMAATATDATPPLLADAAAIGRWLQAELARAIGLAVDEIDPQQSILRYGLDSMLAIELQNRIETRTGALLPMATLLQGLSIDQLATELHQQRSVADSVVPALQASDPGEPVPLSYGQRALWFVQQVAPASTAYTVAQAVQLRATLDAAALRRALQALVDRHEALRMIFPASAGVPTVAVCEEQPVAFVHEDAAGWDAALLQQRLSEAVQQPFDLQRGPLLRAWLFTETPQQHVLLLQLHHIITDFWSQALLLHELAALYLAEQRLHAATLPPIGLRYADYARWQQALLAGPAGERLWQYWQQALAGASTALALPTDRPYPALQTANGAAHSFTLDPELTAALKQFSAANDTTLYTLLLAVFQVLLGRWSGQESLLVGSPVAGRSRASLAPLVGYLVNPVVLRAELMPELPFVAFLGHVRQTVLEALAHQEYPFALLVERLQPRRDPARPPLVQVLFALQQAPPHAPAELGALALGLDGIDVELPGLPLRGLALAQQSTQFELTLALAEVAGGLAGSLQYNRDLFDAATIARLAQHFEQLLRAVLVDPHRTLGALPLLPSADRERMLRAWNATACELPGDQTLATLFAAQANRTPAAIAVVAGARVLSYAELMERAAQLAGYLRTLGVVGYPQAEQLVGVCLPRSPELLVALLGVLQAGAAYVPLDPSYPPERLALMLADSQVVALISEAALEPVLPARATPTIYMDRDWPLIAAAPPHVAAAAPPDGLAYAIYTSGSTGRPKAVGCTHLGVINVVQSFASYASVTPGSRWSWWTSPSFDVSVYEIFAALLAGGALHIVPEQVRPDGAALARWLEQQQIASCYVPPFALPDLAALLRQRAAPLPLQRLLVGAEPLDEPLLIELAAALPGTPVLNGYGPTEVTICSTLYPVDAVASYQRQAPIGRPIANTEAYVLDAQLEPVPVGVVGELYLGGASVARGYVSRAALTAERFLPDPFSDRSGARLYRTGDLVRWLADGNLVFVGRSDQQRKLRGYRIELGEIEAIVMRQPGVREVAVTVREDRPGDQRLVAYVVGAQSTEEDQSQAAFSASGEHSRPPIDLSELRRALEAELPGYMVPSAFVVLDALPLTPSGKTDRRALPAPPLELTSAACYVAPESTLEQTIAALWQSVLGLERIGTRDNFFELGGHSLLIVQVHSQLQTALGRELPLTVLFKYPTVELLARHLSQQPEQPIFQRSVDRAEARRAARRRR